MKYQDYFKVKIKNQHKNQINAVCCNGKKVKKIIILDPHLNP